MGFFRQAKPTYKSVYCPRCGKGQEVSSSAQSVVCHFCHRSMQILDQTVSHYSASTEIATCGTLSIEKKASVYVQKRVVARSLHLQGSIKGDTVVFESARISKDAKLEGGLKAGSLIVEEGAVITGIIEIRPPSHPEKAQSQPQDKTISGK